MVKIASNRFKAGECWKIVFLELKKSFFVLYLLSRFIWDEISIAIAAYHGEKFIAEQLESLLHQTRVPDEVIIGDDSVNLNFEQAVIEFTATHPTLPFELKYYRNSQQLGVNANFYSVAEKASGDIVFFCDQDDFWLPEK